jgi:hypothetical protein
MRPTSTNIIKYIDLLGIQIDDLSWLEMGSILGRVAIIERTFNGMQMLRTSITNATCGRFPWEDATILYYVIV